MITSISQINIKAENIAIVNFAAENLKKYLSKIFGCEITINGNCYDYQISLKTDLENQRIKHDGFQVEIGERETVISAREHRGLLYGAYDFLEKYFGVRFLAPD